MGRLCERFGRQQTELLALREQQRQSAELLEALRTAVLPGRLVSGPTALRVAEGVEAEEVRLGGTVVPREEVRRAKEALLARPGSKVMQLHEGAGRRFMDIDLNRKGLE